MTEFIRIPGGSFLMGSQHHYPEEAPQHRASVAAFELAATTVTNQQFAAFVADTGYITVAERVIDPDSFPGAATVEPGSLVFTPTLGPVDLRDWRQWWCWVPGASWRHPFGPDSDLTAKDDHPVVQIAYEDACAYARWSDARLPTEAEWEFACRGDLVAATYAWGEQPNDGTLANTWQGRFPYENLGALGYVYTAPVRSFPPNAYGLYEMTGNVWEWTQDPWTPTHATVARGQHLQLTSKGSHCCGATANPANSSRVVKGGSHLCSPEYCLRYRPAARTPQSEDSATTHLGFRLARSL